MESKFKTKINIVKMNLRRFILKYKLNYTSTITHRIYVKKTYKIGTKITSKINKL